MKQVLLIGYPFPLRKGGSPRLLGLAKYLPEFGWQPTILSAPLDEKPDGKLRIMETDYREALGFWIKLLGLNSEEPIRSQIKNRLGIKARKSPVDFLLTLAGEIVNYPDSDKGWKYFAIESGNELLSQERIDAIISTSAPVTGHIVARNLKSRFRIPWVADLRDLWTQNHNYSYSPIRKLIDRRLELKTLGAADALVTVSQPWADKLGSLHKGKVVYSVPNGFDPETINDPPVKLSPKFTITYTGTVYARQDPSKLFAALKDLISEKVVNPQEVEVRLYGDKQNWLDEEINYYGLSDVAKQYGVVSRTFALQKQKESQLLLHLQWEDDKEIGTYSGKIFEYLAARRPIFSTGGKSNSVAERLLEETNTGICAKTIEDIKVSLKNLYHEYSVKGKVTYQGNKAEIDKYSHREMARKFAGILTTSYDYYLSERKVK